MTEKYIDLVNTIIGYMDEDNLDFRWGIRDALLYLDGHPDEVPFRVITESEFTEAWNAWAGSDGQRPYRALLDHLGIEVVPDRVPTNAGRLVDILQRYELYVITDEGVEELARQLDADGVTAPEGDQ